MRRWKTPLHPVIMELAKSRKFRQSHFPGPTASWCVTGLNTKTKQSKKSILSVESKTPKKFLLTLLLLLLLPIYYTLKKKKGLWDIREGKRRPRMNIAWSALNTLVFSVGYARD